MKNSNKIILICIFLIFVFSVVFYDEYNDISSQNNENNIYKLQQEYHNQTDSSNNTTYTDHEKALTDEEADKLNGTGYHNTRPNSSAESIEIQAAKVKCKKCGMRSHNGLNSLCDSCLRKEGLIKDN